MILGAETNLDSSNAPDDYLLPGFKVHRFDNPSQILGRGLILYSKELIPENKTDSKIFPHIETVKFEVEISNKKLLIMFMYRSQQYPIKYCKEMLLQAVEEFKDIPNVLIMGDMNTTDNILPNCPYNQIISCQTTSGIYGNIIDHAYVKLHDFNAKGHVLYKSFTKSYHHPICVNLNIK
jgi:hypothetical protein